MLDRDWIPAGIEAREGIDAESISPIPTCIEGRESIDGEAHFPHRVPFG